ncbi:hypothetical protein [Leptothrix discophora]|uniref:Outer membrane protein beta-barrel domain-containing protein n=1 Tax=Leptothrix discophora TaxID=89 RepID=A0ABT9G0G7_LEPDI|nr:hypothetical protein [Leptothrix discophora]MDP4299792.1 hypothetical protein [Leptothrix discophora]
MRPLFNAQVRSPARHASRSARRSAWTVSSPLIAAAFMVMTLPGIARADDPEDRSATLQLRAEPGSLRLDGRSWVARFALGPGDPDPRVLRSGRAGWQLLGDYYFGGARADGLAGASAGLRATGGWIGLTSATARAAGDGWSASGSSAGLRPVMPAMHTMPLWGQVREAGTVTYLGLGYSLGADRSGWGVKADVGLMSTRDGSGGLRLNRSGASMDDSSAVGDLRWLPLLQVGVSYAF